MTKAEAEEAAKVGMKYTLNNGTCRYAELLNNLELSVMFYGGEVARVDVHDRRLETLSGISLGDTEADVLRTYGDQISVEPSFYDPDDQILTYRPDDPQDRTRVVFETDEGVVSHIRSGKTPQVGYVEGCV